MSASEPSVPCALTDLAECYLLELAPVHWDAIAALATLDFERRLALVEVIGTLIRLATAGTEAARFTSDWVGRVQAQLEALLDSARDRVNETSPAHTLPVSGVSEEVRVVSVPVQPITPQPRQQLVVTVAEPFTTVTLDEALAASARVRVAEVRDWLADPANTSRMLFDESRTECAQVAIVRDQKAVPADLWVVGDLHADILSLANIVAHAERQVPPDGPAPAFVFLGDFIDRGRHDHETLLYLFGLIMKNPGRVCVIPGNHDVDLHWREKSGRFGVTIEPAEYCDRLNRLLASDRLQDRDQIELARILIPFWQSRPKAVILPDGTLLAHGGFPHTDTHAQLRTVADLGGKDCVNDFLWARISEGPRKRPNRGNRGHEFGSSDFTQFCRKSTELGLPPIKRFVRGHDHVPNRWQFFPDYGEFPVLTINAMGRRFEGELGGNSNAPPLPVVARYVPHQLPEVIRLPLDPREVERAFPRERWHDTAHSESLDSLTPIPADTPPPEQGDSGLGGGR